MLRKIEEVIDNIKIARENYRVSKISLFTSEAGELLSEIQMSNSLLKDKKYSELKDFYEKKHYLVGVKTITEIMFNHPENSSIFIEMVKSSPNKFKRFYHQLEEIFDFEIHKTYMYDYNVSPLERLTFIMPGGDTSEVFENGKLKDVYKLKNNIKDMCDYTSTDLLKIFSDELLKLGIYKKYAEHPIIKVRDFVLSNVLKNKEQLLDGSNNDDKKYINRVIQFLENEQNCWNELNYNKTKKKGLFR